MEDDEFYLPEIVGVGAASVGEVVDEDQPVACIYVPNTESRSGWGMRMVYRPHQEETKRPIGFGRW